MIEKISWEKWHVEMMEVKITENLITDDTIINVPKKIVEQYWKDFEDWTKDTDEYNILAQNLRNYIKKKLNHTGYVGFRSGREGKLIVFIRDKE